MDGKKLAIRLASLLARKEIRTLLVVAVLLSLTASDPEGWEEDAIA